MQFALQKEDRRESFVGPFPASPMFRIRLHRREARREARIHGIWQLRFGDPESLKPQEMPASAQQAERFFDMVRSNAQVVREDSTLG